MFVSARYTFCNLRFFVSYAAGQPKKTRGAFFVLLRTRRAEQTKKNTHAGAFFVQYAAGSNRSIIRF